MKKLLCLFFMVILSTFFVACLPGEQNDSSNLSDSIVNTDSLIGDSNIDCDTNVSTDTDSDVSSDTNVSTDTDSDVNTDTDSDANTDTDTDTDMGSDTDLPNDSDIGGGNEDTTPTEITVSKTATEIASSIGASDNGDIVSNKEIKLDNNISVNFGKGTSTSEPALYNGAIRIYQKGGTLTINANDGCQIQKVVITFTSEKDGNGFLTVSGGSVPTVTDETITITSKASKKVTVTVGGTSKEDRLYVSAIEVVYKANGSADSENESDFLYNDFTEEEKNTYNEYVGFVIPFMPNNEYYIESYNEDGYKGVYYSALCENESNFDRYIETFSSYEYEGTDTDDFGDVWYLFFKDNIFIDICYYEFEGTYYVDVDAYAPTDDSGDSDDGDGYLYYDFTEEEKQTFKDYIGFVIPFMPNNDYQMGYYDEDGYKGVYFSALCESKNDFNDYLNMFSSYSNDGTDVDEYGDTWYLYSKDNVYIDICYYENNGADYVYVDAYIEPSGSGDIGSGDGDYGDENDYLYYDFAENEKDTYNSYIGFVIPFLPNNDYNVESYNEDGYKGVYYSALCENETAFTWYLAMFSSYSNDGTDVDEYGNTWYLYSKDNVYIDVCYYEYEGAYYVDVDAYFEINDDEIPNENIITNEGAGLPTDDDGVYDVDFTVADKVKDVTDQHYYINGCPTVGAPGVLVIPVEFSDRTASSLGYDINNIKKAFEKDGENDYFSVYDYYFKSSLGKLELDITVVDEWFMPSKASTYYANYTINYEGAKTLIGDQLVMDEALKYLDKTMDLSKFDSDNNGTIDAVVLVTTLKIDGETDFYWAYRFWNIYTDSDEYYFEYDEVSANDYLWASYEFLHENTELTGDYSNKDIINPYTFIHEFGHILGTDDYYDTHYHGSPLGGLDIMDSELGDHNPYTKFNLGWITSSRLVVTDTSVTLTLEDFSKNGDTIIIANNFDTTLGVYQEYYILMYYTDSELNSGIGGYFDKSGIVVYHVDASLFYEEYDGKIYYDVYNTNTDAVSEYGTVNNLIELMPHGSEYVYIEGETMKSATDNSGTVLGYTFTVIELNENEATITVSAK